MKKIFIAILLMQFAAMTMYGQVYTVSKLVNSGKWKFVPEPGISVSKTIYFTETEYVEVRNNDGVISESRQPYYLSSVCPNVLKDSFNFNLVGKNTKGKYIVVKFGKQGKWFCPFKIVELTTKKLALQYVPYSVDYYVKE